MKRNDILLQDYNPEQVDICTRCEARLKEIYPQGIPADAAVRYNLEMSLIREHNLEGRYQFMARLYQLADVHGAVITCGGTVGGSFVLYLLCKGRFNPMDAHYYCMECGHYETSAKHRHAPDMPAKDCPACYRPMKVDGFSILKSEPFGADGTKMSHRWNVWTSQEFMPRAEALLETFQTEGILLLEYDKCDQLEQLRRARSKTADTSSHTQESFKEALSRMGATYKFPKAHLVEKVLVDMEMARLGG